MEDETKTAQGGIPKSFWRRNRWLIWLIGIAVVGLAALTIAVIVLARRAEPILRARIVAALEGQFHAHVELDSLHVSLKNGIWAEGGGLRIWPPARNAAELAAPGAEPAAEGKPLISLEHFRFHAPLRYDPAKPIHIPVVQLEGLNIDLPPHSRFAHAANGPKPKSPVGSALVRFEIGSLVCTRAHLIIETSKPGKIPLEFDIPHLQVNGFSTTQPMRYEAELTNPRPRGVIHAHGSFGPWQVDDPGESSLDGDYHFADADLGTFRGIGGIMDSTGHFEGVLRAIDATGETDTPDFRLAHFGTPLPLHTKFHAFVDGTNGDTRLEQVDATLLHSHFRVSGQIIGQPPADGHPGGHDIALNLDVYGGRMEDFLRLTSKAGDPLLTGAMKMKASLDLPPGSAQVYERLKLKGTFVLTDAHFTNPKIQDRVAELSARGLGQPKQAKSPDNNAQVLSTMSGDFQMGSGVVTMQKLEYGVPGAIVDLKGSYGIDGGKLEFVGWAKLQATVSQIVGGWKGFLLKPLDNYFKKGGSGTQVPIHVSGTRDDPHFGVDFGRLRSTPADRPDRPHDQQTEKQQ